MDGDVNQPMPYRRFSRPNRSAHSVSPARIWLWAGLLILGFAGAAAILVVNLLPGVPKTAQAVTKAIPPSPIESRARPDFHPEKAVSITPVSEASRYAQAVPRPVPETRVPVTRPDIPRPTIIRPPRPVAPRFPPPRPLPPTYVIHPVPVP